MMDAKEAKWFRMFNRLGVNDQRDVGENLSKLSNAIDKMERAIVEGGNIDAVNHVICVLRDNFQRKLNNWLNQCDQLKLIRLQENLKKALYLDYETMGR